MFLAMQFIYKMNINMSTYTEMFFYENILFYILISFGYISENFK